MVLVLVALMVLVLVVLVDLVVKAPMEARESARAGGGMLAQDR
jgi:hypothetical protein